jgi:hypothetical protein
MNGRKLLLSLLTFPSLMFFGSSSSPQNKAQSAKLPEVPLATDQRLEAPGWWPTKTTISRQDFVGTEQCARCHAKRTNSQLTTPMAHASMPASASPILRDSDMITLKLDPFAYAIARNETSSVYSVSDSSNAISETLLWAFGVGNKGQTYIYQRNGSYYESRVSYYKLIHSLDITPGHAPQTPDKLEDALGRQLDPNSLRHCFRCHTTASVTTAGFDPAHLFVGVTCEACHGPGAKHVELMDAQEMEQGSKAIFNPKTLTPVALVDFCGACHRTLNDVYEIGSVGVSNVRFQPYRLENSRCWGDGDARLTCIACHDPHQPLVHEAAAYDEKCLACHLLAPAKKITAEHPGKACPIARKNCVTCHMPRVTIPYMHAPFTDHRIRIARPGGAYPN